MATWVRHLRTAARRSGASAAPSPPPPPPRAPRAAPPPPADERLLLARATRQVARQRASSVSPPSAPVPDATVVGGARVSARDAQLQAMSNRVVPSQRIPPPSYQSQVKWLRNVQSAADAERAQGPGAKVRHRAGGREKETETEAEILERLVQMSRTGPPAQRAESAALLRKIARLQAQMEEARAAGAADDEDGDGDGDEDDDIEVDDEDEDEGPSGFEFHRQARARRNMNRMTPEQMERITQRHTRPPVKREPSLRSKRLVRRNEQSEAMSTAAATTPAATGDGAVATTNEAAMKPQSTHERRMLKMILRHTPKERLTDAAEQLLQEGKVSPAQTPPTPSLRRRRIKRGEAKLREIVKEMEEKTARYDASVRHGEAVLRSRRPPTVPTSPRQQRMQALRDLQQGDDDDDVDDGEQEEAYQDPLPQMLPRRAQPKAAQPMPAQREKSRAEPAAPSRRSAAPPPPAKPSKSAKAMDAAQQALDRLRQTSQTSQAQRRDNDRSYLLRLSDIINDGKGAAGAGASGQRTSAGRPRGFVPESDPDEEVVSRRPLNIKSAKAKRAARDAYADEGNEMRMPRPDPSRLQMLNRPSKPPAPGRRSFSTSAPLSVRARGQPTSLAAPFSRLNDIRDAEVVEREDELEDEDEDEDEDDEKEGVEGAGEEEEEDVSNSKLSAPAFFGDYRVGTSEMPPTLQASVKRVVEGERRKDLRKDYERMSKSMRSWGASRKVDEEPLEDEEDGEEPRPRRTKKTEDYDEEVARLNKLSPVQQERIAVNERVAELLKIAPEELERRVESARASRTKKKPGQQPAETSEIKPIAYGPDEIKAYVAARMPPIYGVLLRVLMETNFRLRDFNPQTMLDFGTGPGTAIWAAHKVFDRTIAEYIGVDKSEGMLRMAEELIENSSDPTQPLIPGVRFQRYLSPRTTTSQPHDLVVASYVLGEMTSQRLRAVAIEALWEQSKDVLVVVEPGTPDGFRTILEVRNMFVDTGDRKAELALGGRTPTTRQSESHIVGPCPHHLACPMSRQSWCHFVQRSQRTPLMRHTKGAKRSYEDEKFSYLVIRRGPRPQSDPEGPPLPIAAGEPVDFDRLQRESHSWPRILRQPMRRSRHVIMDMCTPQGNYSRFVVAKSEGKEIYRDARYMFWGNLWPHTTPTQEKTTRSPEADKPPADKR